jgi:hypothetical protein
LAVVGLAAAIALGSAATAVTQAASAAGLTAHIVADGSSPNLPCSGTASDCH